jgi:hypothetical protein
MKIPVYFCFSTYETQQRAERDNSLKKTWGKMSHTDQP